MSVNGIGIPHNLASKKSVVLLIIVTFVLLAVLGSEQWYLHFIQNDWQAHLVDEEHGLAEYIQSQYISYEKETHSSVEDVANLAEVRHVVGNAAEQNRAFEILRSHARGDLVLELFNSQKQLLSWTGNRGPSIDSGKLTSKPA